MIAIVFLLCFVGVVQGQFALPEIEYDQYVLEKNGEKKIHKGVYTNGDDIVLEAHYPINGSIQSFCHRSNVVYDSVYIYYGEEMTQILFSKGGGINKSSWKPSGRRLSTEIYGKNGVLSKKFTQYTELNNSNPSPLCSPSYQSYFVGMHTYIDAETSKEIIKNYDTGEYVKGATSHSPVKKELERLKPIADKIVADNYGQAFFDQYIQSNYYLTGAYHQRSRSYHGNKGTPDVNVSDGWFKDYADSLNLRFADFTYDIVLSEEERFPIIRVRVDQDGNLIEGIDKSIARKRAITKGLLTQPIEEVISKEDALSLAIAEGMDPNDPNLIITLKWEEAGEFSSDGKLYYEILSNKTPKIAWGCSLHFFDKWLLNVESKEIDKSGEEMSGNCAPQSTRVRKGPNGKYGITGSFEEEPIISFSYDYLQRYMGYRLVAKQNGKFGLISHQEEVLLPFEYDYISWVKTDKKRYQEELLVLRKDGLKGLATKDGQQLEALVYKSIVADGDQLILKTDSEEKVVDIGSLVKFD